MNLRRAADDAHCHRHFQCADQISTAGLFDRRKAMSLINPLSAKLSIRTPNLDQLVSKLSGGNQQKVVLARWLYSGAKVLIFDEPTRGIDVGAKAEVFTLMSQLAKKGVGIIMISSEMPEVLAMADRILVMSEGSFSGEYQAGEATQEHLLRSASKNLGG